MLSMHWQKSKQAFWRSSLLVVDRRNRVASGDFFNPQCFTRWGRVVKKAIIDPNSIAFFSLLIISLGPLFTALLEDIIFRYTLLA